MEVHGLWDQPEELHIGAFIVRMGWFGVGILYCNHDKDPHNSIGNYYLRPLYL